MLFTNMDDIIPSEKEMKNHFFRKKRSDKRGRNVSHSCPKKQKNISLMIKNGTNPAKTYGLVLLLILIGSVAVLEVGARSGGKFDKAQTGCTCHSPTPDPTVAVSINGLPNNYSSAQTYPLTLSLNGGPATALGGFNLEVSSGSLSTTDGNVQINIAQNQASHTNKNQRSWDIDWTAPGPGTGTVTFYLAGNAVNGNGKNNGDGWNKNSWVVPESLDTNAPTISITSPSNGVEVSTEQITVSGMASDDRGLDTVEVKVNEGAWQQATGTVSWTIQVTLAPGVNTIYAKATDQYQNEATGTVNVTYVDSTSPIIYISVPTEGEVFYTDQITVSGTADDDEALGRVEGKLNTGQWQLAQGTDSWSIDLMLAEGQNTIYAKAIDASDNEATDVVNVTYNSSGSLDEIPPWIKISSPLESQVFETGTITVKGNATDNAALSRVDVKVNDGVWKLTEGTESWSVELTFVEGNNRIIARATDSSGNHASDSVNVTYTPPDFAPPVISILWPLNNEELDVRKITVNGTAYDDVELDKIEVKVNEEEWIAAQGTLNWTALISLREGTNTIYARASDTSGNNATSHIEVVYNLDGIITEGEYEFEASFDDGNFILHWRVDGKSIYMAIEGKTTGWVAIGFDAEKMMKDADIIIGSVSGDDVIALDTYSEEEGGPHLIDVDKGGTSDILSFSGSEENGITIIEFKRYLSTGDKYDHDIDPDGRLNVIWAMSPEDSREVKHTKKGYATLDIATGEYWEKKVSVWWPYHAVLMSLGLLLMATGVTIARFMKKKKWWLKAHRLLGSAGAASSVIGIIFAFYMVGSSGGIHFRVTHTFLGALTAIFIISMPILGVLLLKIKKKRNIIRNVHRWSGRITLVLMLFTIIGGLLLVGII
jgi:hypothetical protein